MSTRGIPLTDKVGQQEHTSRNILILYMNWLTWGDHLPSACSCEPASHLAICSVWPYCWPLMMLRSWHFMRFYVAVTVNIVLALLFIFLVPFVFAAQMCFLCLREWWQLRISDSWCCLLKCISCCSNVTQVLGEPVFITWLSTVHHLTNNIHHRQRRKNNVLLLYYSIWTIAEAWSIIGSHQKNKTRITRCFSLQSWAAWTSVIPCDWKIEICPCLFPCCIATVKLANRGSSSY